MPTVEGLQAVSNLTSSIVRDQQEQDMRQAQLDQNMKRQQAAQQAAALYKQGDINGAIGIMTSVDPDFLKVSPQLQGMLSKSKQQGEIEGLTPSGSNPRQLLDARLAAQADMMSMKSEEKESNPTVGESALDKAFAKEYSDFIAKGGYSQAQKNIEALKKVTNELESTDSATGGFVGLLPKVLRDIVTPEGAALQDKAEKVIQSNLRQVLGAQFTEKEGQMLLARSYNPRLSEKENAERLKSLTKQIESAYDSQKAASRYFEDHGTLKGYKGKIISSIDDIVPAPTNKDEQALEWLAANPEDPRAPAIRKKLGL